jgi:formiminotetrahydrofolate cyclodeaminase
MDLSPAPETIMDRGVDAFLDNVAAAQPFPGGGSAAALAGALAAALGEMMAGLTEGREKFAAVQPQVLELRAKMSGLRAILHSLIDEDPTAYKSLLDAICLPKETAGQVSARERAIEEAAQRATDTPLRTARAAVEILEHMRVLIEVGNPNVKCDAAAGAQLAHAALKAGQYNVLANVRILKDPRYAENYRSEIANLVRRGQTALQLIDALITGR